MRHQTHMNVQLPLYDPHIRPLETMDLEMSDTSITLDVSDRIRCSSE